MDGIPLILTVDLPVVAGKVVSGSAWALQATQADIAYATAMGRSALAYCKAPGVSLPSVNQGLPQLLNLLVVGNDACCAAYVGLHASLIQVVVLRLGTSLIRKFPGRLGFSGAFVPDPQWLGGATLTVTTAHLRWLPSASYYIGFARYPLMATNYSVETQPPAPPQRYPPMGVPCLVTWALKSCQRWMVECVWELTLTRIMSIEV